MMLKTTFKSKSIIFTIVISIHLKGDIMLTPETAQRLIPFRTSQTNQLSAALTSTNETFWTENKLNGYYIIGYIINDKLDSLTKQTIPKVRKILYSAYQLVLPKNKFWVHICISYDPYDIIKLIVLGSTNDWRCVMYTI